MFKSIYCHCVLLFCFFVFSLPVVAQEVASPLDIPLLLSGNFGELRNNHFHAGIDIKTQSKTGKIVRAAMDGFVSRIGVSPYGYGNALYIDHPDGRTSVYGHLEKFAPKIETLVRDTQYYKESFAVTIYLKPNQLPVKKGELIAWSGNTGGSGGPHLHFELRDTKTEKALDPLPHFKTRIHDHRAAEIKGLMVFPQRNQGVANGSTRNQVLPIMANKAGDRHLSKPLTAWGKIGMGIKADDRMDSTTNIYGVNEIKLNVDGKTVYHSVMNEFSFDYSRAINSYVDWTQWTENHSFYMKSFVDPGNRLGVNRAVSNGIISIDQEKIYQLEYVLCDVYGNVSTFKFEIQGEKSTIPTTQSADMYFPYNQFNMYVGKGVVLNIPPGNLYTDIYLPVEAERVGATAFAPLYIVGERTPLNDYCPLTLNIPNDTFPDKSKYGVIALVKNSKNWIGGTYSNGKMTAEIRELGTFIIDVDTVPPVITPVRAAKWKVNQKISFKISDKLSGIQSYRGTIDGKFILFEYDAKTNSLYSVYDARRMPKSGLLRLVVTDGAGNQAEFQKNQ